MSNTGSRKQITFDLHQESLKQLYPHTEPPQNAQYYKKAYQDIRRFMTANGFEHRQYSVYVSAEKLTTLDVIGLMEQLAEIGYWEFDVQKHQFCISSELKQIIGPLPQVLKLKKLMSASGYKKFIKALGNLMHHDEKLSLEVKIIKPDKTFAYCLLKADWMCKQHKNIILGTLQDVTEFFNVKKQLINARNEAEKLNREKSFFLAQASHDLRQPLYALKLYLSLLQPKHFSKRQNMLWENINKSADSLKYLLENVLDLSKLDYGGTKTAKTYFNVGMLLSDLGREFKHVANCNDLTLEYQICNCVVYSDAFLIERILRNLLSNAFKFATQKVSMLCYEHKKYVVVEGKLRRADGNKIVLDDTVTTFYKPLITSSKKHLEIMNKYNIAC